MKKTALTFLLTFLAASLSYGQTAADALLISENNYEGTARSVAMGNAFTALGGDLGAVSINPAGSAVSGYSQITLTPSLTFSTNTAYGTPADASYFQRKMKSRDTRFGIPNVGFNFNFNTGRSSGVKSVSVGFVLNRTNSWCEDMYANGTNSQTSFLAAAAADATAEIEWMNLNKASGEPDFTKDDFLTENAYEYMKWKDIVGYRSGMFSSYDADGKKFVGATEIVNTDGSISQAGEVEQTYGRKVYGNKYEYLLNLGMNISDFLYIGFNLGVNSIDYNYMHYFKEGAADPYNFENKFIDKNGVENTTYFKHATYKYNYEMSGSGVFGKIGVIVTPGAGLRFGAAVQTPTANTITEEWQESASTSFLNSEFDGEAESPVGPDMNRQKYRMNSPWRANFGVAYTIGQFALISADYEVAGYKGMKYKIDRHNMSEDQIDYIETVNDDIRNAYGTAHYFRVGAEVKPLNSLSIRAGYNLSTSAQKKYFDSYYEEYLNLKQTYGHNLSFGLGYSSKGSFFADAACRYSFATKEYIYPYSDYLADYDILSPEILNLHSNWKVLLTIGWRF